MHSKQVLVQYIGITLCILVSGCLFPKSTSQQFFPNPAVAFQIQKDSLSEKTILQINPYGENVIPGEWDSIHYLPSLHQHFFMNEDSTYVGIAKNPINRYPFFEVNQTPKQFLVEYFKWDVLYWQGRGLETRVYRNRSDSGYVVWMARDTSTLDLSVLLYGIKDKYAYHLSMASSKLTDDQMADFLVEIYKSND